MELIYTLLCIFLLFIFYAIYKKYIDNVTPFVSQYDGREYDVRKEGPPEIKQTAADYLAKIRHKIDILVNYMYEKSLPDSEISTRLFKRWINCQLKETNSSDNSAAFTLNKSSEIRLCIRDKNGNFENINTSMFVILHELAHVMSISYGHNEEFKNNFSYITHLASELGIYKPENFDQVPKNYCGIEINTTPCENNTCKFGTKINEIK